MQVAAATAIAQLLAVEQSVALAAAEAVALAVAHPAVLARAHFAAVHTVARPVVC